MATDPSGNSVIPSDSSSPIATTGSQTFDLLREGWIDAHIVCTLRGLNWTSASCFQMMIDLARRLNCVLESSPYYAHNMFRVRGILNDITQLQHDSVSPSERENPILHIVFDRCADIFRAALEEGSIGYDATVEQFLRERASQSGIRV